MIRRRSTFALATVGALLALSACGGDDSSGTTTAEPAALEGRGPITFVAGIPQRPWAPAMGALRQ